MNIGLSLSNGAVVLVAARSSRSDRVAALGTIISHNLCGAGKVRQRSAVRVAVVLVEGLALAVDRQHVDASLGRQTVQVDGAVLNRHDVRLARLSLKTGLVVVVEEAVQAGTVNVDIRRVGDTETPGASTVVRSAGREGRVVVGRVLREGRASVGVTLHVGSLGLDQGHENSAGVAELVVVHLRVLRGSAVHPDGAVGLDEDSATIVDVNLLGVGAELEIVVGHPEPGVLQVDVGSRLGDVHQHEGTLALGVGGVGGVGVLGALAELQFGALGAADASVDVPHTSGAVGAALKVPLNHDGTGDRASRLEDHVRNLNGTSVASLADLEDGNRVGHVAELVALGHDHGPGLADNLDGGVSGNFDGVGDDVGAVVEVDNLAVGGRVNDGLNGSGVIGAGITLGTARFYGDEAGNSIGLVLGLAAREDGTVRVGKSSRLGNVGRRRGALKSILDTASIVITLEEVLDLLIAGEDGRAIASVLDGNVDIGGHVDVVNDQGAVGGGLGGGVGGVDADRGVADGRVEEDDGANGLGRNTIGHVHTNLAAVNSDILQGPGPVPVHIDGGLAVLEGQVTGSELLVAKEGTVATAVEGQVAHETTRAVVHKDALLGVGSTTVCAHVEDNVLQRGGLRNLPMDTGTSGVVHGGQVDLEVANLAEEVVLVDPPVGAIVLVRVCINDSHAGESGRGLDDGQAGGIANQLGVVVLLDGSADNVGTGREVDEGRGDGRGLAVLATTATIGDGSVDGGSIIGRAVTSGTIILDVAENGVGAVGLEGGT